MNLAAVARHVARLSRPGSLLDAVLEACPDSLPSGIGAPIGKGGQGETYELGDRVLKIALARSAAEAGSTLSKLEKIRQRGEGVVAAIFESGVLCDVSGIEGLRTDSGTAYYYVMERLEPLSKDDARRASEILSSLAEMHSSAKGHELEQQRKKFLFVRSRELKLEAKLQNKAEGTDEWDETNIDGGLTQKAIALFDRMTAAGMTHVDMNASNVMRAPDGGLRLIDVESARLPGA